MLFSMHYSDKTVDRLVSGVLRVSPIYSRYVVSNSMFKFYLMLYYSHVVSVGVTMVVNTAPLVCLETRTQLALKNQL